MEEKITTSFKTCEKCLATCCEEFTLQTKTYNSLTKGNITSTDNKQDMILDMLIYLGRRCNSKGSNYMLFTCRWLHPETKKCIVYKDRPDMCKYFRCSIIPGRKVSDD